LNEKLVASIDQEDNEFSRSNATGNNNTAHDEQQPAKHIINNTETTALLPKKPDAYKTNSKMLIAEAGRREKEPDNSTSSDQGTYGEGNAVRSPISDVIVINEKDVVVQHDMPSRRVQSDQPLTKTVSHHSTPRFCD